MISTLDRLYLINYFRSYLIVLTSLLALYINLDLFTNLDDFSKGTLAENFQHITSYYAAHISKIFNLMSEMITLIAAMFTVAWMQRSNELLPQLSAGVSTRRVVRPILIGCLITIMLGPIVQEFVIPTVSEDLQKPRDDPKLERATPVRGSFDVGGVHVEGFKGYASEKKVIDFAVTLPENGPSGMAHFTAKEAIYIPASDKPLTGGWKLFQTSQEFADDQLPPSMTRISTGIYFLKTREVDFEMITRTGNWFQYASLLKLRELLAKPDTRRQPAVAVAFHMRITRALVGVLLVLMGLGVILRDQNKNVFINIGFCLILCVLFYAVVYGCKYAGENDFMEPALAAWMPVLVFGPFAFVLFDAVHT